MNNTAQPQVTARWNRCEVFSYRMHRDELIVEERESDPHFTGAAAEFSILKSGGNAVFAEAVSLSDCV